MNAPWNNEDLRRAFNADFDALIARATQSTAHGDNTHQNTNGQGDPLQPANPRTIARTTHLFALAQMLGTEGTTHPLARGLAALRSSLHHPEDARPADRTPAAQDGARLTLASQRTQCAIIEAVAAAAIAGHDGALDMLADLEDEQDRQWWDPNAGAVRDEGKPTPGHPLRRLSTNLDTAGAYLTAWEATSQRVWFDRARSILRLVGENAARCGFALPDLYDDEWRPLPASRNEIDADAIRPGDTVPGLGFKAARLIGQVSAILTRLGEAPSAWMLDTATALYDRALADGWTNTGVGGFVYTLDSQGNVAVPERVHWVTCEAAGAARVLAELVTPERAEELAIDYARAVAWADSHARAGQGRWTPVVGPDGCASTRACGDDSDALTAAHMMMRGSTPIHLSVAAAAASHREHRHPHEADRGGGPRAQAWAQR